MALFWHGHFANQNSVVSNSYIMYRQNRLFRDFAAGAPLTDAEPVPPLSDV